MDNVLKRIKILYNIYNFFSYSKLKHQISLYKNYGVNKSYFSSLTSKDFPDDSLSDHPWLDKEDSAVVLPDIAGFSKLDEGVKSAILNWSTNGFAILKGYYSEEEVSSINELLPKLMQDKRMPVKDKRKIMFAVRYSDEMRSLVNTSRLTDILELLLGRSVELFQSINFLKGSEDPPHSDFFHMSTYPYGYLMAVWIALEDIDEENGPVYYYPGSHKLRYIMNDDYNHGGNRWFLGKNYKKNYGEAIKRLIDENGLEKKEFTASKGDVLIWHANMLHGGSNVIDSTRSRKSMVLHYYGTDVIRYHEITQRPSLKVWN